MKIGEARDHYMALLSIANKKLPVRLAYAVSRNIEKLRSEVELSEKQRMNLCAEYADKDQDGKPAVDAQGNYQIADSRSGEFQAQFIELLETEVTVDIMTVSPAVLDLLDSDRYDPLTPEQITGIWWMIREDETC
ncbi:MAG: hypothetical protein IKH75_10190 [Ruminococcus sp.]|nr:hypothetical protein [Ruminococcus sp.]